MTEYQNTMSQDDEITLKELIIKIQEFAREVLKNWWILLILAGIVAGVMFWQESKKVTKYTSSLTFMIDAGESGGLGGMASLLGSFGVGGKEESPSEKLIELSKSRKNLRKVLSVRTAIDGTEDYLANHILNTENKFDEIKSDFTFTNFNFSKKDVKENSVLNSLVKYIGNILAVGTSETGINTITTTFQNEELAVEFPSIFYDSLAAYYTNTSREKSRIMYNALEEKYDSLNAIASSLEYKIAKSKDEKRNQLFIVDDLYKVRLEKDLKKVYAQLPEVVKNKEVTSFNLQTATPAIQAIDRPIYPLKPEKPSLIKAIVMGAVIGVFLGIIFVVVRKIFRDVMAEGEPLPVTT